MGCVYTRQSQGARSTEVQVVYYLWFFSMIALIDGFLGFGGVASRLVEVRHVCRRPSSLRQQS